jgi:ATP-dependent helicase/nuclease subunit B
MNQGSFPQLQKERCVISDRERRMLRQRNIDLDPDSQRRLLDERFLGYLAFTRPSAKLILTRHTADDAGRAVSPSSFWFELQRLLPALPIQSISRASSSDPKTIGTPRQLVTSLMHWVRNGAGGDGSDPVPAALYQWLFTAPLSADMQAMRDHTWHALRYSNAASLSGELAAALFPPPMELNARQLETAAQCPFRHFARYGLTLRDRDEPDVTGLDLSNAYHEILENLVKDCLETKQDWCGLKSPEAREMIRTHAADIGRRLRGELMLSTARNRYLLDRIERNLEQVVAAMLEMHRRGRYRPGFAALRFGTGAALPPQVVRTPSGQAVHLRGQIDRVDLNHQKSAFVVADYRMGAGPLQLDRVYHGLSLQLLTSLLVIQSNGPQLAGRKLAPAAAFLLQLLRSPQQVDHPSEAKIPEDPNFHLRVKPRGLVEFRAIKSIDTHLTEGYSDVISVYLNKTDGEAGRRNATDAADPKAFEGLIHHVEKRIGELADQISTGEVSVAPFMINRQTPCSHCEFRSVCRFEPGINRYRILPPMKREEVLTAVVGG